MFKRYWWIFPASLIGCPLLGLLIAAILTFIQPKTYEFTTTLQIRPRSSFSEVPNGTTVSPNRAPGAGFFSTEFKMIKDQKVLDIVIDDLDLLNRWGLDQKATRDRLQHAIEVTNIKGTDLIDIRVRAASPDEARDIAERLSNAYRERRTKLEMQRTEQALEELRHAVQKQEDSVEQKRKALTTIIRSQELLLHHFQPNKTKTSYSKLLEQKILLESQIETLLKFDGDQLMTYASGIQLPENIIRVLHPQYLEAKRTLESLQLAGLGDAHPNIKQQKEIVSGMRRDLDEGVIALRETLRAQLELATEQLARLPGSPRSKPENEDNPFGLVQPLHELPPPSFDDAKDQFETAQRLLEQLKIKLVGEEMQRRIVESPVIIHAEPFEAESPIYPTLPRNLLIGSASGLIIGLVLPFLIIPAIGGGTPPCRNPDGPPTDPTP